MIKRDELVRRSRCGEDSTLELIRVLPAGPCVTTSTFNECVDDLAGLANGRCEVAVLGVEDRGGEAMCNPLDRLDAVEAWVRERRTDPAQSLDLHLQGYDREP